MALRAADGPQGGIDWIPFLSSISYKACPPLLLLLPLPTYHLIKSLLESSPRSVSAIQYRMDHTPSALFHITHASSYQGEDTFTFWDVFFWRDAPDWYYKTFLSAGFGFCYCTMKQYLNSHELEVFLPPRSKILPQSMQDGYRNSQKLKYGFLKVGAEVTTIAGAAAVYYGGAYYLGKLARDDRHSWENFAASGALSGLGVSLWLLRPIKLRPTLFGVVLGGALGGLAAYGQQAAGIPFWDESHDFEGFFLGQKVNRKKVDEAGVAVLESNAPSSQEEGKTVELKPAGGSKAREWWEMWKGK